LNYTLLDDPELNNTQEKGVLPLENTDCLSMNGASRSLLSKIVEHEIQERARNEALTNNAEEIRQNKIWAFEEAKKLTAGVVFNGHGCHFDETVFQKIREVNESRERRDQERLDNQRTKNEKIAAKVAAIQEKQMTYEQWTAQELTRV
jgi:hypothetical protein